MLEESGFSFDLQAFDRLVSRRTHLIILNSPGNPTGSVIPLADLQHISNAAQEYDCWVLSDEIYARLAFDGITVPSIYSLPGMAERTIIVDGFSKTYAMTGWRLGFGITCLKPQGAFYAFPNIRSFGRTSVEMANLILEKANVALLPGTAFGGFGEGYLRVVYANSNENIERGLAAIAQVVGTLSDR